MAPPFRAWPYAALAVIQWLHTGTALLLWVVFRHPMDQTVKPPVATWIVSVNGVPKTPLLIQWIDEWTLQLIVINIPALPTSVTVEYDGPDENLRTTWLKQWEPWGAIVATSFQLIPPGVIVIWFGAEVDIPPGWVQCDGNNGTPDLRNRFVVGAGNIYSPGNTGGAINHKHTFTGDGHFHFIEEIPQRRIAHDDFYTNRTYNAYVTGTTDNKDGRPPYYGLFYIMKV